MCVYLKETSIGQALDDYLSSLSEEEAVYTKKKPGRSCWDFLNSFKSLYFCDILL